MQNQEDISTTKTILCPSCKSDDTYKNKGFGTASVISILFFGLPLGKKKNSYHCFNCDTDFKISRKD